MACSAVTYTGVTAAVFDCLKQKLTAAGIMVPAENNGVIAGEGVKGTFSWDPAAATLIIQVTDKPFFLPCGTINDQIHKAVQGCGGH
jgi:hypothetical protein